MMEWISIGALFVALLISEWRVRAMRDRIESDARYMTLLEERIAEMRWPDTE